MSADTFTTEETAGTIKGSIPLLGRYLRELPILRLLILPNCLLAIATSASYQLFIWSSGGLAQCGRNTPCSAELPVLGIHLELTLGLLFSLLFFVLVTRIVQWSVFESGGQLLSLSLFRKMASGVGNVRTTFFDEYPSGKIINRLVRDFDQLRILAPIRIGDSSGALVDLFVATVVIGLANPFAALAAIPALAAFLYIQRNVAPMLQRVLILRSARFGEVLHRETDVIEGARSFVLYGHTNELFQRLKDSVYRYMQMHFLRGRIEAWGRFWSDIAVAIYGFITLLAVAIGMQRGTVSPVLGAVVISAVFRLASTFGWLTWSLGFLFETVGHARRVFEYVDLLPEEAEERAQESAMPSSPEGAGIPEGDLEFVDYSMSYRPTTPLILEQLSLKIVRGSKVGIIGRTGAGKTSLMQSLFRMVYVRNGDIRVGTRSIFSLPIAVARNLFAVVPQDPYLFEGTIRSNLDRYEAHTELQLNAVLQTVQLPFSLDDMLTQGGINLSLGQRQLLCLARVILSDRPFIIMDEPTSGVDTITDAIMQSVLRTALKDRTVLTIAHRLETLAKVDRIVELREGRIIRDGTPEEIIPAISAADLG